MAETIMAAVFAVSFLFSLLIAVAMGWLAARHPTGRRLWGFLAAAWALNLVGDIAWGLCETLTGEGYPGWVDGLYFARYLMVLLAFWLYPAAWSLRQAATWFVTTAGAALVLWFGVVQLSGAIGREPVGYLLGGLSYPALDTGLLYAVVYRWLTASPRKVLSWLALALLCYGLANWINFSVRTVVPGGQSPLPTLLWFLANVFAALSIWRFVRRERASPSSKGS